MKILTVAAILTGGTLITFLPSEVWFLIWWMVGPVGFWQKALIAGAGI